MLLPSVLPQLGMLARSGSLKLLYSRANGHEPSVSGTDLHNNSSISFQILKDSLFPHPAPTLTLQSSNSQYSLKPNLTATTLITSAITASLTWDPSFICCPGFGGPDYALFISISRMFLTVLDT